MFAELISLTVLFALYAKLPANTINTACAIYSLARIAYTLEYIFIDRRMLSYSRSITWWVGNITCFTLFWKGQNNL